MLNSCCRRLTNEIRSFCYLTRNASHFLAFCNFRSNPEIASYRLNCDQLDAHRSGFFFFGTRRTSNPRTCDKFSNLSKKINNISLIKITNSKTKSQKHRQCIIFSTIDRNNHVALKLPVHDEAFNNRSTDRMQ